MHSLVEAGADIIELGVPFSDPMADGPTIQRASERALARGMTTEEGACNWWSPSAPPTAPRPSSSWATPTRSRPWAGRCLPMLPRQPVASTAFWSSIIHPKRHRPSAAMRARGMDPIFLLAPTSTDARIVQAGQVASGYVYYVSLAGVTGAGHRHRRRRPADPAIREKTGLPWASDSAFATPNRGRIAAFADAVVVGSRIIEELEKSTPETACAQVKALVANLRRGVDAAGG